MSSLFYISPFGDFLLYSFYIPDRKRNTKDKKKGSENICIQIDKPLRIQLVAKGTPVLLSCLKSPFSVEFFLNIKKLCI